MKKNTPKLNRGMSTLEILLAFAILILAITAVIGMGFGNQSITVDSQTNTEALYRSAALLEEARADAKLDFNLVNPKPGILDDIYTKSLDVTMVDLFTKKVTGNIAWNIEGGRSVNIDLTTYFTNPDGVDGGDTCSSVLSNPSGWKQPKYYIFPSVNFAGPNANGFEMSDLDVFNKRLYVAVSDASTPNPETFFILDLPDNPSQNPVIRGRVDNNSSSLTGLNAVKVAGNYAYVANAYTGSSANCAQANNCAQLQVIDVSNPANPAIAGKLKIPTVTTNNKLAAGTSIFYKDGYVYLGLAKAASGSEFNVIDVGGGGAPASPTNPIWKGGYVVGNGVNAITVKNNYAYIVSPNSENMTIVDISNPNDSTPPRVGGYTPTNLPDGVGSNHGKEITVIGNTAYLGRTYGTKEFYILNISNPASISINGLPLDNGSGNLTSVNGLLVRDFLAFFITPAQFQVWDISNPNNIKPWTSDGTASKFLKMNNLGGSGVASNCEGDRIYVAVASSQGNNKDILGIIIPGP